MGPPQATCRAGLRVVLQTAWVGVQPRHVLCTDSRQGHANKLPAWLRWHSFHFTDSLEGSHGSIVKVTWRGSCPAGSVCRMPSNDRSHVIVFSAHQYSNNPRLLTPTVKPHPNGEQSVGTGWRVVPIGSVKSGPEGGRNRGSVGQILIRDLECWHTNLLKPTRRHAVCPVLVHYSFL